MATYNSTLTFYYDFALNLGLGLHDLDSNVLKCLLTTSSYSVDLDAHSTIADITNEVSGSGYARQTLADVTWSRSGPTSTLDFTNPVFAVSGAPLVARRYVIWDSTADLLIATGLINDADADVTVDDGQTLTVNVNSGGFFTLG